MKRRVEAVWACCERGALEAGWGQGGEAGHRGFLWEVKAPTRPVASSEACRRGHWEKGGTVCADVLCRFLRGGVTSSGRGQGTGGVCAVSGRAQGGQGSGYSHSAAWGSMGGQGVGWRDRWGEGLAGVGKGRGLCACGLGSGWEERGCLRGVG